MVVTHPNIFVYNKMQARGTLSQCMCSFFCLEILFIPIKYDPNITKIYIFEYCYLYTAYADDTTFLKKDKNPLLIFLKNSSHFLIFWD